MPPRQLSVNVRTLVLADTTDSIRRLLLGVLDTNMAIISVSSLQYTWGWRGDALSAPAVDKPESIHTGRQ
jgi:hypothetical protein